LRIKFLLILLIIVNTSVFSQNSSGAKHNLNTIKVESKKKKKGKKHHSKKKKKKKGKENRYSIDKEISKGRKKNEEGRKKIDKKYKPKNQVYQDSLNASAKVKRKEAKQKKKALRKMQKEINHPKSKAQDGPQQRVYKRLRKHERQTKRFIRTGHREPWWKRIFSKNARKDRV